MLDGLWSDLQFTSRMLGKNPGFGAIAIATLAIGIGANTAIFSLVDHVILRPLAYRQPGRLVSIEEAVPSFHGAPPVIPVNAMHFLEWRKSVRAFESLALLGGVQFDLTGSGEPSRIPAARVSSNLFPMLGVQPQLGRTFRADEDQPGHDLEVVINNELWKGQFGGDPNILGRKLVLDGQPYQVIGVLPANFRFPKLSSLYSMAIPEDRPQIWKPFALEKDELDAMGDFNFVCIARLKAGVSPGRALSELNAVQNSIASKLPEKVTLRALISPLQDQITRGSRTGLQLILTAVGGMLLIACVNIANLLLARSTIRAREMAIRTALGASGIRLLSQMLVESTTLAVAGGAFGVAVAYAVLSIVVANAPVDLPRVDEVRLDGQVLLFTAVISIFCGLLVGVLPALASARRDPQEAMKSSGRGTTAGKTSSGIRSGLVAVEVCLSVMSLLIGALLLHSFINLLNVDKGFEVRRVLTLQLTLPSTRYPDDEKKAQFVKRTLQKIESLPGIESAATGSRLPLTGEGGNNTIQVEGSNLPIMQRPLADIRRVSPGYFRTMSIAVKNGRVFERADEKHDVAVLSASAAAKLWPHMDAVGKRFRMGDDNRPMLEVLGIVSDVRGISLNAPPTPTVYVPEWVRTWGEPTLVVKTALMPAAAAAEIRKTLHELDPQMPVQNFETMQEVLNDSVAQRRFQMNLVLLFAVSALLLASLGIYGVISYSVAQRTNEIGIRMTLGAQRANISRMVIWQGLAPAIAGLAAGVVAAFAVGRTIRSLLFGVAAADPIAIAGVVVTLLAVSLLAALVPSWRATRVDPAIALRYE